MHKVACVVIYDWYADEYHSGVHTAIAQHCSEFMEVDDETFEQLQKVSRNLETINKFGHQFHIVEQLDKEFVGNMLADYIKAAKEHAAKVAEQNAKAKVTREANAKKKAESQIAKLRAQLEKLEAEKVTSQTPTKK